MENIRDKYCFVEDEAIVLGNIIASPELIQKEDIKKDYFTSEFRIRFFEVLENLSKMDDTITRQSVGNYLRGHAATEAIFTANRWEDWFEKQVSYVDRLNFRCSLGRIQKSKYLRDIRNTLGDRAIKEYYDPDLLESKDREESLVYFDSLTIEDIQESISQKVNNIALDNFGSSDNKNEIIDMSAVIEDLYNSDKENADYGMPFFDSYKNTAYRGLRDGCFYLRSASTGFGKAIPNYTKIPTPEGFKQVKDIKVGDYLFGDDGNPAKVIAIYPQPIKKRIYKVEFLDGRVAECCEDHLWEFYYVSHRGIASKIMSTKDILERANKTKWGFRIAENKGYKYKIKINEPVQYKEQNLPIDPYVLGLFLGDGSFRVSEKNKRLHFSSDTDELPSYIGQKMNWEFVKNKGNNYTYTFKDIKTGKKIWVSDFVNSCPQMFNKYSYEKEIPEQYIYSSVEQRYELLKGLLDTDGSIDAKKGRISFTNTAKTLIYQMQDICRSLGFVTSITEDNRKDKYTAGHCYLLHIQCKKELKSKLFNLSKKKERAIKYIKNGKRCEYKEFNSIVNIYPTNDFTDMTCFTVDNKSHLFLMNDYIVTHNTRSLMGDACNLAFDEIYINGEWQKNGAAIPVMFVSTEQTDRELYKMMVSFISGVNEEKIRTKKYSFDEAERVDKAIQILKRCHMYVLPLSDFTINEMRQKIVHGLSRYGVKFVFYDYLHTTPSMMARFTKDVRVAMREDQILSAFANELKSIAMENNIFIMSATQLNASYKESDSFPDQNFIRGSKAVADKIDAGEIMGEPTENDLEALKTFLKNNGLQKPDTKTAIYKNRSSPYNKIYLWGWADRGCCRFTTGFATNEDYEVIENFNPTILEKGE